MVMSLPQSHTASERQGWGLNVAGLIPTPRRAIAGDAAFSMANVKAR